MRYRLVRGAVVDQLRADQATLETVRAELAAARAAVETVTDSAIRAEGVTEGLYKQLGQAHADTLAAQQETAVQFAGLLSVIRQVTGERDQARTERDAANARLLLDAEDRVTLRALLRTARRHASRTDQVYVLFRHGSLHSVHDSMDAAEGAAETEGAPRSGWTAHTPGAPPAAETPWRVQVLPLGGR
ncbi:hypothetical protein AB0957_18310 [Streptomyces zhihengii]|uniref:hypothetical protein n=1 Tax=Streptomyces zhihengii TaxID=1818004 RepID=UPI003454F4D4